YFIEAIQVPHSFDDLRTIPHGHALTPLIKSLSEECHNRIIVHALLALRGHFIAIESDDDRGVNETRGFACEIVAWRFVTHLSQNECIDYLLYELPAWTCEPERRRDAEAAVPGATVNPGVVGRDADERTPLVIRPSGELQTPRVSRGSNFFGTSTFGTTRTNASERDEFVSSFENLNALEVAAVSGAKKFLSQRVVQRLIDSIWRGDIIFWETLSIHSIKEAKVYNKNHADLYSRLRVPRYMKAFEVLFFASFLALYYVVLVQKRFHALTPAEILLYVWITSFAYNEFAEYRDAGQAFYAADFWSLWDLTIVACGIAFFITRIVGLVDENDRIIDTSFDILALEALFLVPRICSLLSLNPYFGTLLPCLKEMTKDFVKFLSLVLVLYIGFLTTFTLLARGHFTLREMSWILVKVFFGSSYLGFVISQGRLIWTKLVFVCLTNILLITSLISLLSNSLTKILDHARDEYLFVYSVYVLEASTSNRLTYYFPPLNLIPLFFRPLRLFVSSEQLRSARIVLLRVTHFPYVVSIWMYEAGSEYLRRSTPYARPTWISAMGRPESSASLKRQTLKSSLNSPRPLTAATLVQASLDGNTRMRRRSVPEPNNGHGDAQNIFKSSDDLRSLVLKLSAQVEQLTAVVAEQGKFEQPQFDEDETQ
ncbi:hypothetical protein NA57DRAFT_31865, partial [Rhizodiscina lignyota]